VEAHGGSVGVTSGQGAGSEFTVTLPKEMERSAGAGAVAGSSSDQSRGEIHAVGHGELRIENYE
jgi:hypothetical protein